MNFRAKCEKFAEHWSLKIIAHMNDYHCKLVKIQEEFVWHRHADTDEVFIVLDGAITMHFREGDVQLHAGERDMIPKGIAHNTSAQDECQIMLVETAGTINTGAAGGEKTAEDGVWIEQVVYAPHTLCMSHALGAEQHQGKTWVALAEMASCCIAWRLSRIVRGWRP